MMTEEQKKVCMDLIGVQHITKIIKYLTKHSYLNKWGEPFSSPFVSNVFHGKVRHEKVEAGIKSFIEELVELRELETQAQDSLFNRAKNLTNVQDES